MTRQERFLTALRVRQPDRVPLFDFLFQQPMYESLLGRRPETYNGRDAVACAVALNHDGVWLPLRRVQRIPPPVPPATTSTRTNGAPPTRRNPPPGPSTPRSTTPSRPAPTSPGTVPRPDPPRPRRGNRRGARRERRTTRPPRRRPGAPDHRLAAHGLREHLLRPARRPGTPRRGVPDVERILHGSRPPLGGRRLRRLVGERRPRRQPPRVLQTGRLPPTRPASVRRVGGLHRRPRRPRPPPLLRLHQRLPRRPGPDPDRLRPPAPAHRQDGPPLGQGTLRKALLPDRQHRFLPHPPLRNPPPKSPPKPAKPSTSPPRAAASSSPPITPSTTASRSRTSANSPASARNTAAPSTGASNVERRTLSVER
jgi:hypothetical protein